MKFMRVFAFVIVLSMLGFLFLNVSGLPTLYDPQAPASLHVSDRYIEKALEETGTLNYVAAVLADYRGFDTLGETTVIFTAGLAAVTLLRSAQKRQKGFLPLTETSMDEQFGTLALDIGARYLLFLIALFGFYVFIGGAEGNPGGGFQGGAVLAISVVISRIIYGEKASFNIMGDLALILAGMGTFIYALIGILTLLWGGNFLEYGVFPLMIPAAEKHAWGIDGIGVGVTLCVMATIIAILDALARREGIE